MTAIKTRPDAESIEHLDFQHTPACENPRHTDPPPANHWIDRHGCDQVYTCDTCLKELENSIEKTLKIYGLFGCDACPRSFRAFAEFITRTAQL